jgi:hypothetical protein
MLQDLMWREILKNFDYFFKTKQGLNKSEAVHNWLTTMARHREGSDTSEHTRLDANCHASGQGMMHGPCLVPKKFCKIF